MSSSEMCRIKNKLYSKFSQNEVKSSGECASLYDLKTSVSNALDSYNKFFDVKRLNIIKKFNRNKSLPMVSSVDFIACNSPRVVVSFSEFGHTYSLVIHENMMYELYQDLFSNVTNLDKTILRCKKDILQCIFKLEKFNSKYPGIDYNFSLKPDCENGKFLYEDGDFKYEFNLDRTNEVFISYASHEDNMTALRYDYEIFEYISFYSDEILKKTEININDISNPIYAYFLRKYLNLENEKTLKL